jgi:hypothetical protein
MSSPAQVIKQLLIQLTLVPATKTEPWAAFVGFLPDEYDTALCVYDTAGVKQGRLIRGGETIIKPGIQVRFRSSNYPLAWEKANAVAQAFDALPVFTQVVMPPATETWKIQNISRTGDILTAGIEEEGDRKRFNFTVNALLTMKKIAN